MSINKKKITIHENICNFAVSLKTIIDIVSKMLSLTRKLIIDTQSGWDDIANERSSVKDVFFHFTLPFVAVCVLFVAVFGYLYADVNAVAVGILKGLTVAISLLMGNYIAYRGGMIVLSHYNPSFAVKEKVAKLVFYSYSVMYLLVILTAIFPSMFFLKVLNVYTAYLVWDGCRSVMGMNEDERSNFVLIITAVILATPLIVRYILQWMLPNI